MSRPNFFCSIEVLNLLLQTEFPETDQDVELSFDLIELPYQFHFNATEEAWTMKAMSRGELYGAGVQVGTVVVNKASGEGEVKANRELAENMGAFFQACRKLSSYIQQNDLEKVYGELDPEQAGLLLSAEDGKLSCKVVSGMERPELMCTTLFGGTVMCRPYMEDFWERSMREEMSLEEKIEEAEAGDVGFMDELAMLYLNGDDEVEQDPVKTVYWLRKLAEAGESNGMFNLGLHYAKGFGVERDFAQAAYWMEQAAEHGDEDAPALVEKYKKAVAALEKLDSGDAQAQADLAGVLMALAGSLDQAGPGKDYEEAFALAQKAASQNNGDGLWALALAYQHGRGVEEDVNKAIEYYRKGAELGHAPSQHSLGCYYMRGDILQEDMEKAFELFMKSAQQGYGLALRDVGRCYQFGNGVEDSMTLAIEWYEKALQVLDDPELERKVALFKKMESSGAFTPPEEEPELPEGYLDALQEFVDEENARTGNAVAAALRALNADFDPETETAVLTEEVVGTQFEGRSQRIEKVRVGDVLELVREPDNESNDQNISVRNQNGESLGNLSAGTCRALAPVMDEKLAQRITAKVCEVIPLSQRGARAKKAILKITVTLELPEMVSCLVCKLAGDQVNVWAQQLTVGYSTMAADHAELLFELYNRFMGEYEKLDQGENDTSYAGLDNLEEEIRAARQKMLDERIPISDYSKDSEGDEEFGAYVLRMIAKEPARYGALSRYEIEEYDDLEGILEGLVIARKEYYWLDQTRVTEEEFNTLDGYNHWYEVLELYEGKTLPVDLSDEDVVSIFGCGKFMAFADLSYGC